MNERVNLTAITDPAEAWTRHILDALTLVPLMADLAEGSAVLDVGSGGGVPGIPMAIARPDLAFTLVEATQKKAAFLTAVSAALGLTNVTVLAERAEVLGPTMRARFDVVTARAVGRLVALVPTHHPLREARRPRDAHQGPARRRGARRGRAHHRPHARHAREDHRHPDGTHRRDPRGPSPLRLR